MCFVGIRAGRSYSRMDGVGLRLSSTGAAAYSVAAASFW